MTALFYSRLNYSAPDMVWVTEKLKIRLTTACLFVALQVLAWKILFLIVLQWHRSPLDKEDGKAPLRLQASHVNGWNGLVLAEEKTAANESGKIRWTFKSTCAAYYGIHCLQLIPNTRDYCVKFYQIIWKYTDKRLLSTQKVTSNGIFWSKIFILLRVYGWELRGW